MRDKNGFDISIGHIDYSYGKHNTTYYNTTEYWDSQTTLISRKGAFYVYTDFYEDDDGTLYPNIKIGDGETRVIDLPFFAVSEAGLDEHKADSVSHITEEEREAWNNKVTASIDEENSENLVLSKD